MIAARSSSLPLLTLVCALTWTSSAPAQVANDEEPVTAAEEPGNDEEEAALLLDALSVEVDALDTANCEVACKALESMMRSAARICDLDAGEPCNQARAKVEAARKRVLAACPDCSVASTATLTPPLPQPGKPPLPQGGLKTRPYAPENENSNGSPSEDRQTSSAPAPPEEASRGGCAPCGVGRHDEGTSGWWLIGAFGLALLRRRRREGSAR